MVLPGEARGKFPGMNRKFYPLELACLKAMKHLKYI